MMAKYVLPRIRSMIAKELIDGHGLTQMEAASKLKMTQAAVSYYRRSKRGYKADVYAKDLRVRALVKEIANLLVREEKGGTEEAVQKLCSLCMAIRTTGSNA